MIEQVIKYSDGSKKVIKYRGVIKDGVLTPDAPEEAMPSAEAIEEPIVEESTETVAEAPVEESEA